MVSGGEGAARRASCARYWSSHASSSEFQPSSSSASPYIRGRPRLRCAVRVCTGRLRVCERRSCCSQSHRYVAWSSFPSTFAAHVGRHLSHHILDAVCGRASASEAGGAFSRRSYSDWIAGEWGARSYARSVAMYARGLRGAGTVASADSAASHTTASSDAVRPAPYAGGRSGTNSQGIRALAVGAAGAVRVRDHGKGSTSGTRKVDGAGDTCTASPCGQGAGSAACTGAADTRTGAGESVRPFLCRKNGCASPPVPRTSRGSGARRAGSGVAQLPLAVGPA